MAKTLCCGAYVRGDAEVVYIRDYENGKAVVDTVAGEVLLEPAQMNGFIAIMPYSIVSKMCANIRRLPDDASPERIAKLCFLERVLRRFDLSSGSINSGEIARQICSLKI